MPETTPPRFPLRPRSALDENQRALYDRIVDGPRKTQKAQVPITDDSGALLGPFGIMTIAPAVGEAVQAVGAALRFSSGLDPVVREAAILLAASHHRCEFEWFAHETPARQAGLDDRQLAALKQGSVPEGLDAQASHALGVVCALLSDGDLDDAAYRAAIGTLGAATLAELVWLCGYYSMLALALAVFDPPNPITADRAF
ncbi:MAG TPA: carboxymuconolactone decarboxylase family protein [Microbacterium sp.]|uniref:carboxymuconolactone decarboxylase family protein n=1 Tax=Microbacterium sp. TaxID=51671 RepID=UPI002BA8C93F|nr:carboxymuconolactone decarboxylase family protein [Microbacterium sp.]HWI31803.1 carboxymuconolactone decarboxylase family protein [Microbacterium sp.]